MSFDAAEIPDASHEDGNSMILWLSDTLGKDPEFLDPWGNEYAYEFPERTVAMDTCFFRWARTAKGKRVSTKTTLR